MKLCRQDGSDKTVHPFRPCNSDHPHNSGIPILPTGLALICQPQNCKNPFHCNRTIGQVLYCFFHEFPAFQYIPCQSAVRHFFNEIIRTFLFRNILTFLIETISLLIYKFIQPFFLFRTYLTT